MLERVGAGKECCVVGRVHARSTMKRVLYRSVARVVGSMGGKILFGGNRVIERRSVPLLLSMKGRRLCI